MNTTDPSDQHEEQMNNQKPTEPNQEEVGEVPESSHDFQRELLKKKKDLEKDEKALEEEKKNLEADRSKLAADKKAFEEESLQKEDDYALRESDIKKQKAEAEVQRRELKELIEKNKKENQKTLELKGDLQLREEKLLSAEVERDNGFQTERNQLKKELQKERAKHISALGKEYAESTQKLNSQLAKYLQDFTNDLTKSLSDFKDQAKLDSEKIQQDLREGIDQLQQERQNLDTEKSSVDSLRSSLIAKEAHLERLEEQLEQDLDNQSNVINERVQDLIHEQKKHWQQKLESAQSEVNALLSTVQQQSKLENAYEHLKKLLGDQHPEDVLYQITSKSQELARLKEELATRPSKEVLERIETLEGDNRRLQMLVEQKESTLQTYQSSAILASDFQRKNNELTQENESLLRRVDLEEARALKAEDTVRRLSAAYQKEACREERCRQIENPRIKELQVPEEQELSETEWLDSIGDACRAYGLHFHPRILYAFHTALKTAEWSPLTILAGVSGTGKSELPRLYSHFGGVMFEPLSVQPNWDSQESMLGFFNSIDNQFDAQPVLRFLAQSQKEATSEYPEGMHKHLCMVLLDEMNLAHPELYFAEFLSKLELRRGLPKEDVPKLPVKLGAGIEEYELPLGRNVLWTGTMNQDETTKALSDKVLDRSIIIFFPRPVSLVRRERLKGLDERNKGAPLLRSSWEKWIKRDVSFDREQITPYKDFVEAINEALSTVGRAIGHRVWQSVEYYMANYPDVILAQKNNHRQNLAKAMHTAFEDQLVQKVMPKLRGIDTRGRSKSECLDKIESLLVTGVNDEPFSLADDFNLACQLGYGQFIWQSANYLGEIPQEREDSKDPNEDPEEFDNRVNDVPEMNESKGRDPIIESKTVSANREDSLDSPVEKTPPKGVSTQATTPERRPQGNQAGVRDEELLKALRKESVMDSAKVTAGQVADALAEPIESVIQRCETAGTTQIVDRDSRVDAKLFVLIVDRLFKRE